MGTVWMQSLFFLIATQITYYVLCFTVEAPEAQRSKSDLVVKPVGRYRSIAQVWHLLSSQALPILPSQCVLPAHQFIDCQPLET